MNFHIITFKQVLSNTVNLYINIITVIAITIVYVFVLDKQTMTTDERGHELDARMFLDKPTTFLVPAQFNRVSGLTVLNDELFVVQGESSQVNVYNTNTFTLSHNIDITGSESGCNIQQFTA